MNPGPPGALVAIFRGVCVRVRTWDLIQCPAQEVGYLRGAFFESKSERVRISTSGFGFRAWGATTKDAAFCATPLCASSLAAVRLLPGGLAQMRHPWACHRRCQHAHGGQQLQWELQTAKRHRNLTMPASAFFLQPVPALGSSCPYPGGWPHSTPPRLHPHPCAAAGASGANELHTLTSSLTSFRLLHGSSSQAPLPEGGCSESAWGGSEGVTPPPPCSLPGGTASATAALPDSRDRRRVALTPPSRRAVLATTTLMPAALSCFPAWGLTLTTPHQPSLLPETDHASDEPGCRSAADGGSRGDADDEVLRIPLERDDGVLCVRFTIDGRRFRGVLDTGSPFLTVSGAGGGAAAEAGGSNGSCAYWGCWRGEGRPSGLEDTLEMFASQDGEVQWRRGDVQLLGSSQAGASAGYRSVGNDDATHPREGDGPCGSSSIVFGVFLSLLLKGGAGDQSLVGLVKHTGAGIRPSLLGQTPFRSFSLDFGAAAAAATTGSGSRPPLLTLSSGPSLVPPTSDWVPLVDLRRVGAPSQQYVVELSAVYVNGRRLRSLLPDGGGDRPLYGMIDSGSTGLFISEKLFYPLQREAGGWRSCDVEFQTASGRTQRLSASRASPAFLAFATDFPWLSEDAGYMLVLGTVFLEGATMTVDMEASRLLLTA